MCGHSHAGLRFPKGIFVSSTKETWLPRGCPTWGRPHEALAPRIWRGVFPSPLWLALAPSFLCIPGQTCTSSVQSFRLWVAPRKRKSRGLCAPVLKWQDCRSTLKQGRGSERFPPGGWETLARGKVTAEYRQVWAVVAEGTRQAGRRRRTWGRQLSSSQDVQHRPRYHSSWFLHPSCGSRTLHTDTPTHVDSDKCIQHLKAQ